MISWAIETLVATTLLLVLVLALREPVRRWFGSNVAYALWLLPVARLFLPQMPGTWQLSRLVAPLARRAEAAPGIVVGVMNPATLPVDVAQHATIASAGLGNYHATVALVPPTATTSGPGLAVLAVGLWVLGAALFLGYHLIAHLLFCRRLLRRAAIGPAVAGGSVRVIESAAAATPLAFGIWRKYVAFPRDFAERYDADERELALLHEIGHHQRGDLIANWVALGMLALHWFNPIGWRAFRAFRADQEMANDARVLAGRSAIERHTYACAIVKAAHPSFGTVAATCQLNTVEDLKGRLKMLTTGRRSRTRLALGGVAVAALTIGGLAATAGGTAAASTVRAGVEKATGLDIASLDAKVSAKLPVMATMPTMQAMPAIETMPETPAIAMPAPPAPPAASGPGQHYRSVETTDGKTTTQEWSGPSDAPMPPGAPRVPNVPEVRSANCGAGDDHQMVEHKTRGDKQIIIVCNDRIARAAERGAQTAAQSTDIERMAYRSALEGLRSARAQIAGNRDMSAADRSEALTEIDSSIKEVEADLANVD